MMHLFNIFILLSFLSVFNSFNLFAQKKGEVKVKELTNEDFQKIYDILSETDKKIETALRANPKNFNSMKADIEKIAELKDEKQKVNEINDYQKKYSVIYANALKSAKIDMNEIVKNIRNLYPGIDISIQNNVIQITNNSSPNRTIQSDLTYTETIKIVDYKEEKVVGCGLGAGGDVKHTLTSLEVNSFSAIAGGCLNNGLKSFKYNVPSDAKSAIIKIKAKLHVHGFAVGVVGAAMVINTNNVFLFGQEEKLSQKITTLAPFLWVGHNNLEEEKTLTKEYKPKDKIELRIFSQSNAISMICCATYGKAEIYNIDAKIDIKR